VRTRGFVAKAGNLVFFIGFKVALKPFDMAVAFKSQYMRGQSVKEEAVMADDHGATSEAFKRFFKR
jgi:hypothetical protein